MPERVGVFGGTFDPVHVGHLVVANEVRYRLGLDRMLLVVAPNPWQKAGRELASAEDRLAMVAAAVEGIAGLEASDVELRRDGPTYTVDTLRELTGPGRELFLVVGSDVADQLGTWEQPEVVAALATLVVVGRAGEPATAPPGFDAVEVAVPSLEVSSTDIRQRVATGEPVDFLVPAPALRLLQERGLYARRR